MGAVFARCYFFRLANLLSGHRSDASSGLAYARRSGFGGAYFSDAFIDALGRGFTLRGAFEEELVVENLPIVELSFDSNDTFEGTYNDFSESGTYRIVIYAQDNDGRLSYPTEIEIEVVQVKGEAERELYLPLVIR